MVKTLTLSNLSHVWVLDLDGTLVRHNKYKTGEDEWIDGALNFIKNIPDSDFILILTGRKSKYKKQTIDFLNKHSVRFNKIIFDVPLGERILINDKKPSGLVCAYALNVERDKGLKDVMIGFNDAL